MQIGIATVNLIVAASVAILGSCSSETVPAQVPRSALFADAITTSASPDGSTFAVWTKSHEVLLVDSAGSLLQKIGIHSAAPIFSHDGHFVAYEKLADSSLDGADQSLFELAKGIAVYDLQTGKESLVTEGGGDDYAPVGFSHDLNLLYFNSSRAYENSPGNHVASLWVVNRKTGVCHRLTNVDESEVMKGHVVPTVNPISALWTTDRTMVITSYGVQTGVWKYELTDYRASATRVADGETPQWAVPDESITIHTLADGKSVMRTINVH